jgi:F420-0:gamma-glutamyl ligase-like protein
MTDSIHPAPAEFTQTQLESDEILRFFHYAHLPEPLREVSAQFCRLAGYVVATLPRNPERTVALRKLLESKDCAVRTLVK